MISCSIQGGSKLRPWCLWTCCWYRCTCQLLFQWAMRTIMWDMGPKKIQSAHGSSGSTQGIHVPKPWFRVSDFDNFATQLWMQVISFEFWTFKTHVEWMQFGVYCWLGLLWLWKDVVLWFGPTFWQMFTMCSCEL